MSSAQRCQAHYTLGRSWLFFRSKFIRFSFQYMSNPFAKDDRAVPGDTSRAAERLPARKDYRKCDNTSRIKSALFSVRLIPHQQMLLFRTNSLLVCPTISVVKRQTGHLKQPLNAGRYRWGCHNTNPRHIQNASLNTAHRYAIAAGRASPAVRAKNRFF